MLLPRALGVPRCAMRFAVAAAVALTALGAAGAEVKVLRIAAADIDTLDPQQYTDDPSFQVIQAIYEPAFEWDYLASPPELVALTAAAAPEIADDGKTWTIKIKPGIRFTDHPAFKGTPRELTAQDYVYAYKRWIDPNGRRGGSVLTDLIVGARSVVDAAKATGRFDFDRPIEGLRALDRFTLRIRLTGPSYPNVRDLIGFVGAVAREVVEAEGPQFRAHPVGTGPYKLREWKRGSRVVLEANAAYREAYFPRAASPAAAPMQGKRVPQIGVVELDVIEEDVTRLLQFEQGGLDYVALRGEVANRLLVDGKLKAEYAARGITAHAFAEPFLFCAYFNMRDGVVGGMTPERIALRRAIALALDRKRLIEVVYAGQGIAANQLVPPGVGGHDPSLPPAPPADVAAAKRLLDRFGYKVGADGYRERPDGAPLTLTLSLRTGAVSREIQTLWKRDMDAIGVRTQFRLAPFQDVIKELEQGQYQIYFGGFGGSPSGYPELLQLYGKQSPRLNVTRFALPEYDRAAEAFMRAASDAEQVAAARRMSDIAATYVPLLPLLFRLENDFVQPWVKGFRPMRFSSYWKYLDVERAGR